MAQGKVSLDVTLQIIRRIEMQGSEVQQGEEIYKGAAPEQLEKRFDRWVASPVTPQQVKAEGGVEKWK